MTSLVDIPLKSHLPLLIHVVIECPQSVLVSGSEDGTARIWDLEALDEVKPPPIKCIQNKRIVFELSLITTEIFMAIWLSPMQIYVFATYSKPKHYVKKF